MTGSLKISQPHPFRAGQVWREIRSHQQMTIGWVGRYEDIPELDNEFDEGLADEVVVSMDSFPSHGKWGWAVLRDWQCVHDGCDRSEACL